MSDAKPRKKVTFKTLQKKMAAGEPITQLAAYDYRTAVVADRLGMDILCVSDTGGMILFGHQSTTAVSFDEVMPQLLSAHGSRNRCLPTLAMCPSVPPAEGVLLPDEVQPRLDR